MFGTRFYFKNPIFQGVKIHKALSQLIPGPAKGVKMLAGSEIYKTVIYTHTLLKFNLYDQMSFNI